MYSFSKDETEHNAFYEKAKMAYQNIFKRAGIGHLTYLTFASGGTFSKFSHEFQTLTPIGEDTIYLDENSGIAINKEVYNNEIITELNLSKENFVEKKAVEVGNIFSLGTKFSAPFDLKYKNENTQLILGADCAVREFVTLNRGTTAGSRRDASSSRARSAYQWLECDSRSTSFALDRVARSNGSGQPAGSVK